MLKKFAVLLSGALFLTIPAFSGQWDKKTLLTFDQPIELPGVVLPAGQYVFKLVDSQANRNIVRVFSANGDQVFATILAVPHYRMTPADKTVILFEERTAGQPQAIHAWFYPGENFGQEFVYPKSRAFELAQMTHQPVLTGEVTPTETPTELENTPVVAVTPENKEVEVAAVPEAPVAAPPTTEAPAAQAATPEPQLPHTASPLPAIGLLGFGSLSLAWLLRTARRRIS